MARLWSRVLAFVAAAGLVASCAELQGLDGYEKVACLDDCPDSAVDASTGVDASTTDAGVDAPATCPPCSGSTPVCDPVSLKCVQCLPGVLACAVGQFCDPDPTLGYACAQGCSTVSDCFAAVDAGLLEAGTRDGGADAGDGSADAGDAGDGGLPPGSYACCNNRCIDTSVSTTHCGTCGNACGTGAACCGGSCTDTVSNTSACGACGASCSATNISTVACSIGKCSGACDVGFDDCNNDKLADGCESDIYTNPSKCGACNKVCSNNHVPTPSCAAGACNGACESGWADCNNNKLADGCEIQPATDPDHCGGCPNQCSNNNMDTRTCSGSVCNGNCKTGFKDCNANKLSDGCEINIGTDVTNCGDCGVACSANHVPARSCASGTCNGACEADWADCNLNKQTDGCEINVKTDPAHCGACPNVCSSNHITPSCTNGACDGACAAGGWADCNNNKLADGCEALTGVDTNHCTACNAACPANAADYSGATGRSCVGGACTPGYGITFPPVAFIDACSQPGVTPTALSADDSATGLLALPFAFSYYGNAVTNYWYSTNGVLGFGTPSAMCCGFACPPSANNPGPVIMGYAADLYLRTVNLGPGNAGNTGVCTATVGAAPNRKLVVTWKDSTYCCSPEDSNHLTFSIILEETTNRVAVVYNQLVGFGTSGFIGVQSAPAAMGATPATQIGTSYSCNGSRPLAPGDAVVFIP